MLLSLSLLFFFSSGNGSRFLFRAFSGLFLEGVKGCRQCSRSNCSTTCCEYLGCWFCVLYWLLDYSRCYLQNGRKTFETIPSAPRLRLKASGMAERLPFGPSPRPAPAQISYLESGGGG